MNIILNLAFICRRHHDCAAPAHAGVRPIRIVGSVVAVALITVTACGSNLDDAGANSHVVRVVASTDVYGDIADQIGGDRVRVTSIIDDPDQDPHSYEASPQDQVALSKARVIIENGGGYDDFMDTLRRTATRSDAIVLNAVDISGRTQAGGTLNEHVWYDFPSMRRLAGKLAEALALTDPSSADIFRTNAARFSAHLHGLENTEAAIRATSAGRGVVVTEPVPLYMLDACGLDNRTPEAFSKAIEDGTDVSPRVLEQTLALIDARQIALLAYNEQASSPQTERVLRAARRHGVPVVPVTETLPAGQDYLTWMSGNVAAVESALGS